VKDCIFSLDAANSSDDFAVKYLILPLRLPKFSRKLSTPFNSGVLLLGHGNRTPGIGISISGQWYSFID